MRSGHAQAIFFQHAAHFLGGMAEKARKFHEFIPERAHLPERLVQIFFGKIAHAEELKSVFHSHSSPYSKQADFMISHARAFVNAESVVNNF